MIEIVFLCILAVLIYKTPEEIGLFYDNVLGKLSSIVLLILISSYFGIPCAIIFILMLIVIASNVENNDIKLNVYDYRKIVSEKVPLHVNDKNNRSIKNITNVNISAVPFFNKEREIGKYHNSEEIIQAPR
tara:strand:- start:287 stop:679 length:393 start_codon:yes stop_codon:yes gene_type:complete